MICPECGSNSPQFREDNSKLYWDCERCEWQVEIKKPEAARPKFVQLETHVNELFALDSEGVVWRLIGSKWVKTSQEFE